MNFKKYIITLSFLASFGLQETMAQELQKDSGIPVAPVRTTSICVNPENTKAFLVEAKPGTDAAARVLALVLSGQCYHQSEGFITMVPLPVAAVEDVVNADGIPGKLVLALFNGVPGYIGVADSTLEKIEEAYEKYLSGSSI